MGITYISDIRSWSVSSLYIIVILDTCMKRVPAIYAFSAHSVFYFLFLNLVLVLLTIYALVINQEYCTFASVVYLESRSQILTEFDTK